MREKSRELVVESPLYFYVSLHLVAALDASCDATMYRVQSV